MSALVVDKIRKSFGALETLRGIDIALESGEFLVLLGASGCGKSTLLNIIAGLAEPSGGDVRLDGRSLIGVHPKDRDIAMVFQSYALYPNLSVRRNIGFGLEMRKVPAAEREKAVLEAARLLQIEPLLDRRPSQLSGGQRQRVAIGRALVRHPKLFLFDEPLSNLDAKLRMEMRTELKRLHQMMKTTVVYVTHDQIEAMTLATRIAVMQGGQIEQLGTPEEIYNRPATLYVATFVGAPPMNLLDAVATGSGLQVVGSDTAIPLPPALAAALPRDHAVKLGIRPESFRAEGGGLPLTLTCDVTELTGPELILSGSIGGQRLVATLPPRTRAAPGETITLALDVEALHLFDVESGRRIEAA
ncbi:ABC transporter ATP-binding protein [Pleomorphomonas koreensis]|uniref:ABC transporter ATP-binding protein n=1 Tax=Pleomorphomonas koreensis TaxID=257440 RepID=UPI00040B9F1C|nr:sn-glycerol-3-phosphate ABC transporter ATP-binding protein UgpC [Pleomorphomonas koreensis]